MQPYGGPPAGADPNAILNECREVDRALDRLLVEFGKEIVTIIPGKVSTEVDARFSFSTEQSVEKALRIIDVRSPITPPLSGYRGC